MIDILSLLLFTTYILFLYFSGGIYQEKTFPSFLLTIFPIVLFPLILAFLLSQSYPQLKQKVFWILLCSVVIIRILMVVSSPRPIIDVFTQLKEGPMALLSFQNPYTAVFSKVYTGVVSDYYNYWPVSLVLELPFVALFSDPRILLIIADIFNALILVVMGKKKPVAYILSLVYLFRPNSNFVIEQSFLSSLELFFLYLAFYVWDRNKILKKRDLFLGFILGLLIGIKQIYMAMLFFFMPFSTNVKKLLIGFLTVFVAIILPFIIWDIKSFWADTIGFFLNIYEVKPNIPIYRSLNLNTLYFFLTGNNISFLASFFFLLLFICLFLYRLKIFMRDKTARDKNSQEFILLGVILFYLSFYLFLSHAFINYYFVVSGLIILLAVKMLTKETV